MESEQYMKSQKIKKGIFDVLCLAVKHHGQAMPLQISIIQFLTFYEHLSEILAEGLTQLRVEYDYPQLGDEVIREIAGKTFSGNDNKGPRSFAKFLVKYAESCPRSVLKQLSLLLDQLDSEVRSKPFVCANTSQPRIVVPNASSHCGSYRIAHHRACEH
jgi:condensin complex subunit 1